MSSCQVDPGCPGRGHGDDVAMPLAINSFSAGYNYGPVRAPTVSISRFRSSPVVVPCVLDLLINDHRANDESDRATEL